MFSATLIIAFYNNIRALNTILLSLEHQTNENFEVIIADDGSCDEAQRYISRRVAESPLEIQHVRQLDKGFRKNRILNKAIHLSRSDYLIFIDGDCIPQQYFIFDHISNRASGYILNGRRVDLSEYYLEPLLSSNSPNCFFKNNLLSILYHYFFKQGRNVEKGFRIKNKFISHFLNRKPRGIVGCNFSLYKHDILSVNGFNNKYESASIGEDTDIEYRLVSTGMKIKNIFFQANILHVIHPIMPRKPAVFEILKKTKENKRFIALDGYSEAYHEE